LRPKAADISFHAGRVSIRPSAAAKSCGNSKTRTGQRLNCSYCLSPEFGCGCAKLSTRWDFWKWGCSL